MSENSEDRATGPVSAGEAPERLIIFDTTLRDGEQCPGGSLHHEEKLQVARALARLQVDVIEAGFPVASQGDFAAVRAIAEQIEGPIIAALARCREADIQRAAEAVQPAGPRARLHVFLATSPIHRQYKLKKAESEILKQAVEYTRLARSLCADVEFSPEDASRTEPAFLCEVVQATIEAGARTINIPDTVGYAVPEQFGELIRLLRQKVPHIAQAVLSVHCHNDLGLAVANSLAAITAGARQVECTINGIGERAGNAALEEIVMIVRTRKDFFGQVYTHLDASRLVSCSRLVANLTGLTVQRNKAIVGENAFAHEAGIHVHGMLAERSTYEIMRPEDVGFKASKIVIGKHSGRHGISKRIKDLGYDLPEPMLEKIYAQIIELADKKKVVHDADLEALISNQLEAQATLWTLEALQVASGNKTTPTATVTLADAQGQRKTDAATGDGPVDAVYNAIDRLTGISGKLLNFEIRAVGDSRDAQGQAAVEVEVEGVRLRGTGLSTDIVEASALAYLNAISRLAVAGKKARETDAASSG